MRIGCLQFAPQVGDIDNNLNRADAVLSRSDPGDLDLLVLPELAFTGYNFKSLQEISPFLEPHGSGISSLWARTSALKYDCTVIAGYPEKVDPHLKWPTGPEYYNSAIVVNEEGETIANYRKSHLYYTDETWALEGPQGFFRGRLPRLGRVAIGICMDINPYKFQTPWDKYEFANHVLDTGARLVIVSMAWITQEDPRMFSRMPQEPDMETLTYWISRLEPIIRAQLDEEIIIIFANRSGVEGETTYAGTSSVIGIKSGEVRVYGILGRGDKALLVVDTDAAPYARLVYRPDGNPAGAEENPGADRRASPREDSENGDSESDSEASYGTSSGPDEESNPVHFSSASHRQTTQGREGLCINTSHHYYAENPSVNTPTAPSPTPLALRPHLSVPAAYTTQDYQESQSPGSPLVFNDAELLAGDVHFHGLSPGSNVSPTYASESRYSETSVESSLPQWEPSSQSASIPVESRWTPPEVIDGLTVDSTDDMRLQENRHSIRSDVSVWNNHPGRPPSVGAVPTPPDESMIPLPEQRQSRSGMHDLHRPESTKSRNASRSRGVERSDSAMGNTSELGDICRKLEDIAFRAQSAEAQRRSANHSDLGNRLFSPPAARGSRNTMRSFQSTPFDCDSEIDDRAASRAAIPIGMDWSGMNGDGKGSLPSQIGSLGTGPAIIRPASLSRIQSGGGASPGVGIERTPTRNSSFYRNSARSNATPNYDDERAVSRGRPRATRPSPRQHESPSTHRNTSSGSRQNRGTPAEPIDLSQFRLIEEYPSADCPVHGTGSRSGTGHRNTSGSRPRRREQSRSQRNRQSTERAGSRQSQDGGERAASRRPRQQSSAPNEPARPYAGHQVTRAATTDPRPTMSQTNSTVETVVVVDGAETGPKREPKTPVAMVLLYETQDGGDDNAGLTLPPLRCVDRNDVISTISRPRSAVW